MECSRRKHLQTTHLQDLPDTVTITRIGHAFEGRALIVLSRRLRRGRPHLLLILPDQSRALIPADWTSLEAPLSSSASAGSEESARRLTTLGSILDLLRTRAIVDALCRHVATAAEDDDAIDSAFRESTATQQHAVAPTR